MKEDRRDTNHPIATPETSKRDTVAAELAFDGISYGKGAQFLRMLVKFAGESTFNAGVRLYTSKYQHSNATLDHFVSCLGLACDTIDEGVQLEQWALAFLSKSKGVIGISMTTKMDEDGNILFYIKQKILENATEQFMEFKLDVKLFLEGGRIETLEAHVLPQKKTPVSFRFESESILALLPNSGMHAYCLTALDPKSVEYLTANFREIDTDLDQLVFIKSLSNMVRDGTFSPLKYLQFHFETFMQYSNDDENDIILLTPVDNDVLLKYCHDDAMATLKAYVPESLYPQYCSVFRTRYQRLQKAKDLTPNEWRDILDYIISLSDTSPECQSTLTSYLEHKDINQSQKYSCLLKLCSDPELADKQKDELCAKYLSSEKSSDIRCQLRCLVVRPNVDTKSKYWDQLLSPGKFELSQTDYGDIASAFLHKGNGIVFADAYADRYLEAVPKVFAENSHFYARQFLSKLMPTNILKGRWIITDQLAKVIDDNVGESFGPFLKKYASGVVTRDRIRKAVLDGLTAEEMKGDWIHRL